MKTPFAAIPLAVLLLSPSALGQPAGNSAPTGLDLLLAPHQPMPVAKGKASASANTNAKVKGK